MRVVVTGAAGGIGRAILPTPVLLATGIVDDLAYATTSDLKSEGNPLYLLGSSRPELGGSLWARQRGGPPLAFPPPDPVAVRRQGEALLSWQRRGWVRSVHDVSEGGLAVTLPEMAFGGALGFDVDLDATGLPSAALALVAEGGSRWVLEVDAAAEARLLRSSPRLPLRRLGEVVRERRGTFRVGAHDERDVVDLERLYPLWRAGPASP